MGAAMPEPVMREPKPEGPISSMVAGRVQALGMVLARRAMEAGLVVTQSDGSRRAIPIGALPVVLDDRDVEQRARVAEHLVRATDKVARWRLAQPGATGVLDALGPAERRLVLATVQGSDDLAVARVDFLGSDEPRALEVNATIPAMQGYSEIAAEAWLATFAGHRPDLPQLLAANGSNVAALQHALGALYAQRRRDELCTVGLLCRRGDAQLTEVRHLCHRFRASGWDAHVVHPDELRWHQGFLHAGHTRLQLVYRHLFLSRLDHQPCPELETSMAATSTHGTLVLNRPAPHLEMKSTLAWLSVAADDDDLAHTMALTRSEVETVRSSVPWTRNLHEPVGRQDNPHWLDEVKAHPDGFVLKRSWSYGGNEVFVGRAQREPEFWIRVHRSFPHARDWATLVAMAANDPKGGGFVVQRAVPTSRSAQWLCTPDAIHSTSVVTDYAAFASLGVSSAWGGVCRAAASDVVNIVGGGGVVPILRKSVMDTLLSG